jgi:oxygen-independent coproporphyrinogen-3 oxidase
MTSDRPPAPSPPPEPGFGVYVHWPFCASKCPYCDFNSHVRAGGIDETRYLAAYTRELAHVARLIEPSVVTTIFFGGGTPSLMSPAAVGAILDAIAGHWPVDPDAEITLEANPSSVEAGRFRGYRNAGVNRVSLGVQSLRDGELRALGRLHTVAEARKAVELARRTFERWSFDLIYARPGQTAADWHAELGEALALAAGHLSLYQLTIEAGTPFAALHASGRLRVPEPELAGALYVITQEMTAAAGLPQYEISNHARRGEECRHNLLYWRYGPYAGIGPGAHGRLLAGGDRFATSTERNPERWLSRVERDGHGLVECQALSRAEQADELLLMGLRITEGVDLGRLAAIGGVRPGAGTLRRLAGLGLVELSANGRRLEALPKGRFVLNEIVARLAADLVPSESSAVVPASRCP